MSVAGRLWAAPARTDLAIPRNTEMVLSVSCLGRSIALTFRIRSIPNELENLQELSAAQRAFSSSIKGTSAIFALGRLFSTLRTFIMIFEMLVEFDQRTAGPNAGYIWR